MLPLDPRLTDAPTAQLVARLLHDRRDWIPSPDAGLGEIRRRTTRTRTADDAEVSTVDVRVPTRDGPIEGRWYLPARPTGSIALFLHGGGWVLGDLEMNDLLARDLARASGCRLLSIDYRLAPEHPHPAALHDSLDALRWLIDQEPSATRRYVIGHSAGGNLAAVLAQQSAAGAAPRIDGQILLCPVLDCDLDRDSYHRYGEGLLLTRREMQWYWEQYQPDSAARSHPSASPLRSDDPRPLPPATIVVAGADVLRDEAEEYARSLAASGVATTLHVQEGVPHLYLTLPSLPSREQSLRVAARGLTEALEPRAEGREAHRRATLR